MAKGLWSVTRNIKNFLYLSLTLRQCPAARRRHLPPTPPPTPTVAALPAPPHLPSTLTTPHCCRAAGTHPPPYMATYACHALQALATLPPPPGAAPACGASYACWKRDAISSSQSEQEQKQPHANQWLRNGPIATPLAASTGACWEKKGSARRSDHQGKWGRDWRGRFTGHVPRNFLPPFAPIRRGESRPRWTTCETRSRFANTRPRSAQG